MIKLKILDWGKQKREVDFVGYNNARTICYIVNENHEPRAIDLWLPSGYGLKFAENPIPTQPPDEICRSVLCLPSFEPPLEVDEEFRLAFLEAKSLDKSVPAKDPLSLRSLHPRDSDKWDARDLDKKLMKALRKELQRRRDKVAAIERQIAKLPAEEAKTARIHCLPFPEEIARDEATTLDDVKQGKFGLRARVLQQEFMEHHQLDPKRMETDYIQFCGWIRLEAKGFAEHNLEKLAKRVRYAIHFTDNTGCWLEGIHGRSLTSPQEIEEFQMLEAAAEVAGDERMSCDEVCRALIVKRKGESKPMTTKGLEKLCAKARVPFKFPMRRSVVKKLEEHRKRRRRDLNEKLRKRNKKADT